MIVLFTVVALGLKAYLPAFWSLAEFVSYRGGGSGKYWPDQFCR